MIGAVLILLTWSGAWASVGNWLGDRSVRTLTAGLPVLLAAVLAGLTWTALCRVVP